MEQIVGIDLARWQGVVAFEQFVASGIEYTWIKCTHGASQTPDMQFVRNWQASRNVFKYGRGAYLWLTNADPILQVERCVTMLERQNDIGDLFPAVDFEEPNLGLLGDDALNHLRKALRRLKQLTGGAMVYTGDWYWKQVIGPDGDPIHNRAQDIVEEFDLWHSQYPRIVLKDRRDCGHQMPDLPKPHLPFAWRLFGKEETVWQVDGDGGCVLPSGVDADFNITTREKIERVRFKPLTVETPTIFDGAATPLRAGEAEHTIKDVDTEN